MATSKIQTVTRHRQIRESRANDYLYDPIFTVSSVKDHIKEIRRAAPGKAVKHFALVLLKVSVSVYENMFSDLGHFPSKESFGNQITFQDIKPLLERNTAQLENGNAPLLLQTDVGGRERFKYFKRPLIPYHPTVVSQLIYARRSPTKALFSSNEPAVGSDSGSKNVGIQTVYRDSVAQTDPFSPEFVIKGGENNEATPPEILALSALTYGMGLPASLVELDMIERARAKRMWEKSLPEVVDEETFQKRLRMMEEMELIEWKYREEEIERLQSIRLDILREVIQDREEENDRLNKERIHKMWQTKLQERDSLHEQLDRKKNKMLRKLNLKRIQTTETEVKKHDIIEDYVNYGSSIYVPRLRDGHVKKNLPESIEFSTAMDATTTDIKELRLALNSIAQPNTLLEQGNRTEEERREYFLKKQLDLMLEIGEKSKNSLKKPEKSLTCVMKIERQQERPKTPVLNFETEEEERKTECAIMLQRTLRGQSNQIRIRRDLIRRNALVREARLKKNIQENAIQSQDTLHLNTNKNISLVEPVIGSRLIGRSLDFIAKEIVRLREEQRIAAMVKLAERTRRMREAEESGSRQQELQKLREQDEIFKQILRIHHETVDSYLEELILQNIEKTSDSQAKIMVREYAERLNSLVDETEKLQDPEMAVANLMSTFLIPHVEKESLRSKIAQSQEPFLAAAHSSLYGSIHQLTKALDSRLVMEEAGKEEIQQKAEEEEQ